MFIILIQNLAHDMILNLFFIFWIYCKIIWSIINIDL